MDARTATGTPFRTRRAALAATLAAHGGGIAIVPTAPTRQRNGDNDHPYRHGSDFHHLTGFAEPDAWLAIDAAGATTLVCRPKDPEREIWDGVRLGPDAAPAVLGVDRAVPLASLDETMVQLLADQPQVWVSGESAEVRARVEGWIATVRGKAGKGIDAPRTLRDLDPVLAEMRLFKDASELDTMRRAAAISADAHARAMRFVARRLREHADSGVPEYEIEAELLHEFRRRGSSAPAYGSIVAGGANACVLHYDANDALLQPGELCLIDAGCELDGYASDITRTFPASGIYSGPQRELYDIVLAAQQAAIDATKPGARRVEQHAAATRVLSQGMLDTGLLDRGKVGDVDAVIESGAFQAFFMHGTGHWLGRDVHDVGEYTSVDEAPVEQSDWRGGTVTRRPSRHLEPGMVLTIEPGIYVRPAASVPERYWNIGIRIEDDAIVTATGCELISRGVPVDATEIEALMRA